MFDTICTYPLPSDLFTQAIHPSAPLFSVGLASGHVKTFRLPSLGSSASSSSESSSGETSTNGCGTIDKVWATRRHKGSCRSLTFSHDGDHLFSGSTDGIIKNAKSETGVVQSKIAVPLYRNLTDPVALLHVLSPQTLLVATDSAALHLFDFRGGQKGNHRAAQTHHPHDDYISSLTPLPPTEASTSGWSKQWVTTGGSTLAVTDLRRGVLAKSENQEDELLSSVYVGGLGKRGTSVGEKILVGGAGGVITLWEKGVWDDQDERITVDGGKGGGESLDVLTRVPEDIQGFGRKAVVVGLGDGRMRMIAIGPNKVVAEYRHDESEGVVGLGFEAEGRMISGGGPIVKVWQEMASDDEEEEEEEEEDENGVNDKRERSEDSDDSGGVEDSSEGENGKDRKRRKKRKRSKGRDKSGGKILGGGFKGLD